MEKTFQVCANLQLISEEEQSVCDQLLVTAPVLKMPDFKQPFLLATGASDYGAYSRKA